MSTGLTTASADAPKPAPIDKRSGKPLRIPSRVRQAIDLLASGECKTQKAAAERVGLSREHLARYLAKDHVGMFIARRVRRTLALGTLRASDRVLSLIDASSEHVSLDASKHVLAIAGVSPPQGAGITINNTVSAGYVIELKTPTLMTHESATEAKPLIEQAPVPPKP